MVLGVPYTHLHHDTCLSHTNRALVKRRSDARRSPGTWLTLAALIGIGILIWWTFADLGVFDLWTTVSTENGVYNVVNTFASVDHPFHATRAQLLLDSLQQGELLRWIPSHEGG